MLPLGRQEGQLSQLSVQKPCGVLGHSMVGPCGPCGQDSGRQHPQEGLSSRTVFHLSFLDSSNEMLTFRKVTGCRGPWLEGASMQVWRPSCSLG